MIAAMPIVTITATKSRRMMYPIIRAAPRGQLISRLGTVARSYLTAYQKLGSHCCWVIDSQPCAGPPTFLELTAIM